MTEVSTIIELYSSGLSLRAIGERIGRSHQTTYRHLKKAGIQLRPLRGKGPLQSQWTGGRLKDDNGYWKQWIPADAPMASMRTKNGYVKEHRLVMARKLGRPLLPTETVHHIDGDKGNNAEANLELRQGKHGKHIVMCCQECGSRNIGPAPLACN